MNIKAHDLMLFFIHMLLFLGSIRYAPVLSIVSIMLVYPYHTDIILIMKNRIHNGEGRERKKPFQIPEEKQGKHLAIPEEKRERWERRLEKLFFAAGCTAVIATFCSFSFEETKMRNRDMADILLSEELVKVIKQDAPDRLFNHYNAGGYLIMNDIEVFLYQSYEPFADSGLIQDYLALDFQYEMEYVEELGQMQEIFDKYNFDGVLLHKGRIVLEEYLLLRGDFAALAEDENYRYYGKMK